VVEGLLTPALRTLEYDKRVAITVRFTGIAISALGVGVQFLCDSLANRLYDLAARL
jgi:hypothetical protein